MAYVDEVPTRTKDFSIECVRVNVRLTAKDWDKLDALEFSDVFDKLKSCGAYDLDYNGHFGCRAIFEAESHAKIVELIDIFFNIIDGKLDI